MHKRHLIFCAAGITLAIAFVAVTGPSTGGLGVLAATLLCPLAMVIAMKFLMGSEHGQPTQPHDQDHTAPERNQLGARHP